MSGYIALSSQYKNQTLTLFEKFQKASWWSENPIIFSSTEDVSIDLDLVYNALSSKMISPLKLSGLSFDEMRDPVINKIETAFKQAVATYEPWLKEAIEKDAKLAEPLNEAFRRKIHLQSAENGWLATYLLGSDPKEQEENQVEKLNNRIAASAERRAVLKKIAQLEKARQEHVKNTLQKVAFHINNQFHTKMKDHVYDQFLLRKVQIYQKMFRALFPDTSFISSLENSEFYSQVTTLSAFSNELHTWIQIKFLNDVSQEAQECGKLILSIINNSKQIHSSIIERFLLEIVKIGNYSEIKRYLLRVNGICEKNFSTPFFQCITTKKVQYYSLSTLHSITKDFYELVKTPSNANIQTPFPCFDEGGKELLQQLKNPHHSSPKISLPPLEAPNIKLLEIDLKPVQVIEFDHQKEEQLLAQTMAKFAGKDRTVSYPLPEDRRKLIERQYMKVFDYCQKCCTCTIEQLVEVAKSISTNHDNSEEKMLQFVAIGRLALFQLFKINLHQEQILTVLAKLTYPKGCVAQVLTGEGKTFIKTLQLFVLTMQGRLVHLVTSSDSLSIRDHKVAQTLLNHFHITSSHICERDPKESKFQSQVIFGRTHDFQFAIMREMLNFSSLFPQKNTYKQEIRFDCVIIDELDNLTIDTALNHARLSYPTEITYEWVYFPLFAFLKENIPEEKKEALNHPETILSLKKYLQTLLKEPFAKKVELLTDKKLKTWLYSAFKAAYHLKEKTDYVVGRTKELDRLVKAILIVDAENTGHILQGCRWSNGLHECVEVKHGLIPEKESLTPLSLSHPIFYLFYKTVYGLTGTMGSQQDREEVKEIYGIDSFDVPTHLPCQRIDKPLLIVDTMEDYWREIVKRVYEYKQNQRPLLTINENIRNTEILDDVLKKENLSFDLFNEIQSEPEEAILQRAGRPEAHTVATNNAGRGIDILLNQISKMNGGLHSLLTFYPKSLRVEYQNRGRGGRQGDPGSSEIIISREHVKGLDNIQECSVEEIETYLKNTREVLADQMKASHIRQASLERFRFNYVLEFFQKLKNFNESLKNETLLTTIASSLANLKFLETPEKRQTLFNSDDILLRDSLYEFLSKGGKEFTYRLLLKQVGKKIIDRCLNNWSIHFNQLIDDVISESDASFEAFSRLPITKFFFFSEEKTSFEKQQLEMVKNQITSLYVENKPLWEKYLDPSGSGLILYLEEISGLNLSGIVTSSTN